VRWIESGEDAVPLLDPCPRLLIALKDEEFAGGDGIENAHADIIGRQSGGLPCLGRVGPWPFVRSPSPPAPPRRGMKRLVATRAGQSTKHRWRYLRDQRHASDKATIA